MKKKLAIFMLLTGASLFFTSCTTAMFISRLVEENKEKKEILKYVSDPLNGTPDNSVLMYGYFDAGWGSDFFCTFFQADTSLPPQFVFPFGRSSVLVTKPLKPNGRYKLFLANLISGKNSFTTTYGLQGHSEFDFIAPKKTGLYYYGAYTYGTTFASLSAWKITRKEYSGRANAELEAIKIALEYYKGTAWEPLLTARQEELKNAK